MKRQNIPSHYKRIIKAFEYSFNGLKETFHSELAFRQELFAGLLAIPLALYLGKGTTQKALLLGSYLLILIVELMNTAIESAIDRVSTDHHDLSKKAKDIASAAVFLSIVNMTVIWLLVIFF